MQSIPASDVQTVLLFATGSGISPIRAVIESGVLEAGKRKEVRLYYGTRTKGGLQGGASLWPMQQEWM